MVGLEPKTGRELWKGPGGNLLLWRKDAHERVIAISEHRFKDAAGKNAASTLVSCVEPKTGKVLWKAETPLWSPRDVGPTVEGDLLVGCEATKGEKAGEADFAKDTQVLCYRLKEDRLEKAWAVPAPYPAVDKLALAIAGGCVYVAGSQETFCLKLETGEKLGAAKAGGARTQTMFAADGRVFIQPEGRHGGQSFFMLDGAPVAGNGHPKSFRLLPASASGGELKHAGAGQWVPPHVPDTAYANHPVGYPLVDGRLFVRGHDGLYCYDLRKQEK
jgi:outer membrane protein assembly factor BamB